MPEDEETTMKESEYTSGITSSTASINKLNLDPSDDIVGIYRDSISSSGCCNKRRFQCMILGSLLITFLSLCIVVPVVVVTSKKRAAERATHSTKIYGSAWVPLGDKLLAEVGDQEFGESVDLSGDGNYLAIGSNAMDDYTGQVEVRQYTGLSWRSLGGVIRETKKNQNFGYSVQLSQDGKILAVGGFGSQDSEGDVKGIVRCYRLNESIQKWEQIGQTVKGDVIGDQFGISLSMSKDGTSWIVGADNLRGPGQERNGYAKVYSLGGTENDEWKQKGSTIFGLDGERTGYAVSMSGDGNAVCVGDRWYKVLDAGKRGRVRCFDWNNDNWYKKGDDIVGTKNGGEMGHSLSSNEDGTIVAIGNRYGGNNLQGSVSVFQSMTSRKGNTWNQMGSEQVSLQKNDQGGFKVDLNSEGNVLVWTARGYNGEDGSDQGIVRIARWGGREWQKLGNDLLGDTANDYFGESVAINDLGTIVAASANWGELEYVRAYSFN